MSSQTIQPGDVEIREITLSNSSRTISIMNQVIGYSLYESIMNPVVTAEFQVYDPLNILQEFPIIGEETITVSFATPGYDDPLTYTLAVNAVTNQMVQDFNKAKSYVLRCASQEILLNAATNINKRYSTDAGTIVSTIIKNSLSSKKNINIEKPKGIQDVLLARIRPFQAIDMVRRRTVSAKYDSASYCFFENQRGFNFTTIENLMDNGKTRIGDKVFFFSASGGMTLETISFRNLLGFKNVSMVNNNQKIALGGLKNISRKFDIFTGETTEFLYTNLQDQQKFKFATDTPAGLNTSQFESLYGTQSTAQLLVPHDSDRPETYTADYAGKRQAFCAKIAQNLFQAHAYGDTGMSAGDVVTINLPSMVGTTQQQEEARLTEGNYLVSRLRHMVTNSAGAARRKHTMSMECIKGTFESNA
jgi:hypothetical protein